MMFRVDPCGDVLTVADAALDFDAAAYWYAGHGVARQNVAHYPAMCLG
jgi:hypothetical protein